MGGELFRARKNDGELTHPSHQPPSPFLTPSPSNILLTASFGHLIPTSLLSLFPLLNTLNVHPSLLPLYRGAAPIQWALANGEGMTGVSVQELSRGKFDQGRLLGQREVVSGAQVTRRHLH